ncbi:hypothetical protein LQ772_06830 [Frateuria edaphi]|uniref:phage tail assembly chaperone n=1 Tax=Frateuria edaphi TaxID=2898793 RepID=UPI001E6239F5|nr:hypothetical protein [Frateuria edaphi]UGB47000.1 hypothetical protein LQ772_06830 [Frateuria edaphi]
MTEFEINGQTYQAAKLDAFKQFHIARRLAPLHAGLSKAMGGGTLGEDAFSPAIAEAVAGMPDADCDYILQSCLAVVKRRQGDRWVSIMAVGAKALTFDDIDMGAMLQVAGQVITENIGGFFGASADPSGAAIPPA